MRIFSFRSDGRIGLAIRKTDCWVGLTEDDTRWVGDLSDAIVAGTVSDLAAALASGHVIDLDRVVPDLSIRRPQKVLCVGLNYKDHVSESKMDLPTNPTVFVRFGSNLIPNGADIVRPAVSEMLDFEGELVAVIGKAGRSIPLDDALEHVAGYTVFNDGSIRDFQLRTNQWTIGKNFDNTGALSSEFVSADELPKGAKGLKIETRLNGQVMQSASTDDLIFSIADLVSQLSVGMTLQPGDLIVSGTPSGVGFARDPKVFMKPGDVCEVEIERVALLRNPVVAEA